MEPIAQNGAVPYQIVLPAGFATRDISGAANVTLTNSEGDADLIELTGLITGNIVVTVPLSLFVMVVGTTLFPPSYETRPSWLKVFKNSTAGAFTVTIVGPGGVGALITQGQSSVCFSHDGHDVNVTSTGAAGPAGPAGTGIGLAILYQPGGIAASNVVTTEAQLHVAVTAEFAAGGGPFVVAVDSSLGAATLAGAFNWAKRVSIVGANPDPALNVLTVTALQTDIAEIGPNLSYQSNLPAAPTLAFSTAASSLAIYGNIRNLGAHAVCDIPAGQTLKATWYPGASWSTPAAGAVFGLLTNTSVLTNVGVGNPVGASSVTPAAGLASGVVGSVWTNKGDRSWMLMAGSAFGGTFTQTTIDQAQIGAANLQLGDAPEIRVVGSTAGAVAVVVDTHYVLPVNHGGSIVGQWTSTDRNTELNTQAQVFASIRNYPISTYVVGPGTVANQTGDGALATAAPSFSIAAGTLNVTFTPPGGYAGNLDWILDLSILQN